MTETAWMWRDETSGGVMGATVDLQKRLIQWFDQPGCACGGSDTEQTIADFIARGARHITLPAEVETDMRHALLPYSTSSEE